MDPLQPGDPQQIGSYVLRGRLGAGGMGEVFFGHSPGGRPVAVKLIRPVFATDPDFRRRFRLEVEAARKVGGFHTAQVVDAQPDADRPWLVTAYVAGPSLARVIARHGALPVRSVRVLGAGLAEALQAIHAAGLIHRDLKPSNILLADDGPRVIDFGIARAMDASGITALVGTPGFMAPEVLTGAQLTPACDLFALGMVLAFASGVRPFGEGPSEAVSYRVVYQQPDLSCLDPSIREVVAACLAKAPADRPSPEQLVRQFASPKPVIAWLPEPVSAMAATRAAGYQQTVVADTDPARAARLLAEAEQLARAITDDRSRALALVHVAAVVTKTDAAHAARLLDDAMHPPVGRQRVLAYLTLFAADDIGTVLARMDADPARRLIAEMEAAGRLDDGNGRVGLAEGMAAVDPDWAVRIACGARGPAAAYGRAEALAAVSRVVARSDITRAAQIAGAISDSEQQRTPGDQLKRAWTPGRRRRASGASRESIPPPEWTGIQASALAYIAVIAVGSEPAQAIPFPAVATQSAPTAIANPVGTRPSADPGEAERLFTEAERIAHELPEASDDRAQALSQVKCAAAQVWPDRSGRFLAEAEQQARAITGENRRSAALGHVAIVAARIDPSLAALISGSLNQAWELGPVALALAKTDPERAMQIAERGGDPYLVAVVKVMVRMATERARTIEALHDAAAASCSPSEIAQTAVLAAPIDPDWAERLLRPASLDSWGKLSEKRPVTPTDPFALALGAPSPNSVIYQLGGVLECVQASGLADLANAFLGNRGAGLVAGDENHVWTQGHA